MFYIIQIEKSEKSDSFGYLRVIRDITIYLFLMQFLARNKVLNGFSLTILWNMLKNMEYR